MPTTLPLPSSPDVLYVMDLSGYVFRAYHAIRPLSGPTGEPTHATYGMLTMLRRLLEDRKPQLFGVAMDSQAPCFRKQIDPEYKANRPPPPEDLSVQMRRCRQIVAAHRLHVWQRDGFEADDFIAAAVRHARAAGLRVVIVSADKDLMQLVGDDVLVWDTMRDKVYGTDEVREKFGVPPARLREVLALTGDTSDNIPGVKSVGPKTAADLVRQFTSFDDMYGRLDTLSNAKLRGLLAEHKETLMRSYELVGLRDDVIDTFEVGALRVVEPDVESLRSLYTELGFTRMLEALGRAPVVATQAAVEYEPILNIEQLRKLCDEIQRAGRFSICAKGTSTDAMRAALIGVALCCRAGEAYYVPLSHRYLGAPAQLTTEQLREALTPLLTSEQIAKSGHCLKVDEILLRRHGFGPLGGVAFDSMVASYLLDPENTHALRELAKRELQAELTSFDEVTEKSKGRQLCFDEVTVERATAYSAAEADMSLRLWERLGGRLDEQGLTSLLRDLEMPLSKVLVQVEMTGVLVDTPKLQSLGSKLDEQIKALEATAREQVGHDFNVNSPRQLETILFDELKLPVLKKTKTARSTDASVLEALAEQHPLPATILEQRQLAKLKNTYIDTLPQLVNPQTGRIHTSFNQSVAATGRLSSSDPNLQNIPVRTDIGRAIREAFVAREGCLLVSADYSQIELRVLAHLAQDPVLIEAFRSGQDVHTRTAMELFAVGEDGVTQEMRRRAKTINFGVIYGMGEVALAKRLGIGREEAAAFIEAYFRRYDGVKAFMQRTLEAARAGQAVHTLLGRRRHLKDLGSANRALRAQAERMACNTPIQGSAADILKLAMVKLAEPVVPGARMILTVHDELVFEVPEANAEEAGERIREAMEQVVKLEVPLTVDVGAGKNWAEAH